MPRGKGKGNLKTFIFTVDANDTKYTDLINYLESIDNGARSYVIRQILNSYIGNQCIIPPTNIPNHSEDKVEQVRPTETISNNSLKVPSVRTKNFTPQGKQNKKITNNKPVEESKNAVKQEDIKEQPSEGMTKLMQNFL